MINSASNQLPHTPTPLIELHPGLLAKLECNNLGVSHKVRAARQIIKNALMNGDIIPGETTVIEKTGGNFGFGLTLACSELDIPVELAVGLGFSPVKRRCLEFFGAKLIGLDMLKNGSKPKDVIQWHLDNSVQIGKKYFFTDQFNNRGSLQAHLDETGPEIASQLQSIFANIKRLTFVACAGTGASLTGIASSLKSFGYSVNVVLVEPLGCDSRRGIFCDHAMEGMSVGVPPPFLDWNLVNQVHQVSFEDVLKTQSELSKMRGLFVGNTTGACMHVAIQLCASQQADHKVLTVVYDHGLWYLNTVFSGQPSFQF